MEIIIEETTENVVILIDEVSNDLTIEVSETIQEIFIVIEEIGIQGQQGYSAYTVAINNGFLGNEADWLLSLRSSGTDGGLIF